MKLRSLRLAFLFVVVAMTLCLMATACSHKDREGGTVVPPSTDTILDTIVGFTDAGNGYDCDACKYFSVRLLSENNDILASQEFADPSDADPEKGIDPWESTETESGLEVSMVMDIDDVFSKTKNVMVMAYNENGEYVGAYIENDVKLIEGIVNLLDFTAEDAPAFVDQEATVKKLTIDQVNEDNTIEVKKGEPFTVSAKAAVDFDGTLTLTADNVDFVMTPEGEAENNLEIDNDKHTIKGVNAGEGNVVNAAYVWDGMNFNTQFTVNVASDALYVKVYDMSENGPDYTTEQPTYSVHRYVSEERGEFLEAGTLKTGKGDIILEGKDIKAGDEITLYAQFRDGECWTEPHLIVTDNNDDNNIYITEWGGGR